MSKYDPGTIFRKTDNRTIIERNLVGSRRYIKYKDNNGNERTCTYENFHHWEHGGAIRITPFDLAVEDLLKQSIALSKEK